VTEQRVTRQGSVRVDVSIAFILVPVAAHSNRLFSDNRLPYNLAFTHLHYS